MALPKFDPDFATWPQWAAMYRAVGWQVIPAYAPGEDASWKRPKLSQWTHFQNELVPDATFARWYDATTGEHRLRRNMGLLSGKASKNVFVVDLDMHKNPAAMHWWNSILEVHNNGLDLETVEQITGGGGKQKLFLGPAGWIAPTNRTPTGVDIRGQGGFAMLPPSWHESGHAYDWAPGRAPWEVDVLEAPPWLLAEVAALVAAHGGHQGNNGPKTRTASPGGDFDPWGQRHDGREDYMTKVVWAAVVDWHRECPIQPPQGQWADRCRKAYEAYERNVVSREPGTKQEGLEREGRGPSEFWVKWQAAMRHWDGKVAADAKIPNPNAKQDDWTKVDPTAEFNEPQADPTTGGKLPLLLSSRQFVAGFIPPAYLIDGIMQRGYIYSLTARTNHGKTAVSMYMSQAIARGERMHGREVEPGTVLMLAGENPDDIRARFLVLAEAYEFRAEHIKMRFMAGVKSLIDFMPQIRAEAEQIEDLVLVVVDTAAAYFPGDDANDNTQQGAYARILRSLTTLRGKPAVLVNCHPVKNAARDNLLPMGGSAFVNEVDGNLTLWDMGDKQVSLHWQGKFRGPEFEPLVFELRTQSSDRVKDAKGRLMPSVVAYPITELLVEMGEARRESDENVMLRLLHENQDASFATLATKAGFMVDGKPHKRRVQAIIERLRADKLVERHRGGRYRLTRKGLLEIGEE